MLRQRAVTALFLSAALVTFGAAIVAAQEQGLPGPVVPVDSPGHVHPGEVGSFDDLSYFKPQVVRRDPKGQAGSGGPGIAHRAGGRRVSAKHLPDGRIFYTGTQGAEPTLGVDNKGAVFYVGLDPTGTLTWPVVRSTDEGATWKNVSPKAGPFDTHVTGQDPFIWLDKTTGRLFDVDFTGPCSMVSFTDDQGESWLHSEICGHMDHQNLFGGPPKTSGTVGYPNALYYCAIDGGALAAYGTMTACSKSIDGGINWVPTGEPAFIDNPDQGGGGMLGIPGHCGGATGHGFVDHKGNVYVPRGYCGQPYLAISRDEGASWKRIQVARNGMPFEEGGLEEHEAGVAVDRNGTIYYAYTGRDRLPYLVTSRNDGKSWSPPMMIGPPGLKEASLPTIDVGANGKIAFAYIGSKDAPGGKAPDGSGPEYEEATWHGYVTISADADSKDPLFYSATVNDPKDPLVIGSCGILRCQQEYDFIDVVIGPDGTPWTAMVDGCIEGICQDFGLGVVGRLVGGPSLR